MQMSKQTNRKIFSKDRKMKPNKQSKIGTEQQQQKKKRTNNQDCFTFLDSSCKGNNNISNNKINNINNNKTQAHRHINMAKFSTLRTMTVSTTNQTDKHISDTCKAMKATRTKDWKHTQRTSCRPSKWACPPKNHLWAEIRRDREFPD